MTNARYTAICLLIDQSGSMNLIKAATEEAVNSFVREQAEQAKDFGRRTIRIMAFSGGRGSDFLSEVCPSTDAAEVKTFTLFPTGSTALLDAIGTTLQTFGKELADLPEDERPGRVTFAIMTDGAENSSMEFTFDRVKEMIQHQEDVYGWNVVYLGANQDAIQVGGLLGVKENSSLTYSTTERGVAGSMSAVTNYVATVASGGSAAFTPKDREESAK